jgi:hypothetical protein
VPRHLREALTACGLASLTLYEATPHFYGAQHVMAGGSLATLREVLEHTTVQVTERYGHLRPDLFRAGDLLRFEANMSREGAEVINLAAHRDPGETGDAVATRKTDDGGDSKASSENS